MICWDQNMMRQDYNDMLGSEYDEVGLYKDMLGSEKDEVGLT